MSLPGSAAPARNRFLAAFGIRSFRFQWSADLLAFAQFESKTAGLLLLAMIGLAQSLSMVSMSVVLLLRTAIDYRGRVMGVRMLAVYGLPIGLLAAGALVDRIGFAAQTTLYAIAGLAAATAIAYRWRAVLRAG